MSNGCHPCRHGKRRSQDTAQRRNRAKYHHAKQALERCSEEQIVPPIKGFRRLWPRCYD